MFTKYKVSCVIPTYNEAPRISYILSFLSVYKPVDEVVVVDDGSTDSTQEVVQRFIANLPSTTKAKFKLVNLDSNSGKGNAFKVGIEHATGDVIIMSDADIVKVTTQAFDVLLTNLSDKNRMVVLDNSYIRSFPLSIAGMTRLWSGQRAMFKQDLNKIDWSKTSGYKLESSLNQQYIQNNWKAVYAFAYCADSVLQFEKLGSNVGLKFYVAIAKEIFGSFSVMELLWHRINSPIKEIRFAYFTYLPKWARVLTSWITLSAETMYGMYLWIYINLHAVYARQGSNLQPTA